MSVHLYPVVIIGNPVKGLIRRGIVRFHGLNLSTDIRSRLGIRGTMIPFALAMALFLAACSSSDPASSTDAEGGDGAVGGAAAESEDSVFFAYELTQPIENTITISISPDSVSKTTGFMDQDHTCEGADTSPQLTWEGVPAEAKSLALILDDPASDELEGLSLWTHWVLYSIPTSVTELSGGQPVADVLENGAKHGANDYEKLQYSGPCPTPTILINQSTNERTPPILAKERPYFFKLYALDKELDLAPGVTRDALLKEIDGHIVAAGELAVPYKSRRKEVRAGRESRAL